MLHQERECHTRTPFNSAVSGSRPREGNFYQGPFSSASEMSRLGEGPIFQDEVIPRRHSYGERRSFRERRLWASILTDFLFADLRRK